VNLSVAEIPERLPEPDDFHTFSLRKDDRYRIELALPGKVAEYGGLETSRLHPHLSIRPVEHDRTVRDEREPALLDARLPMWAVRVDDQRNTLGTPAKPEAKPQIRSPQRLGTECESSEGHHQDDHRQQNHGENDPTRRVQESLRGSAPALRAIRTGSRISIAQWAQPQEAPMRYLMTCAFAFVLGCAPGTEPEDATHAEEVAIRIRVEVEEPRLVRRKRVAGEPEEADPVRTYPLDGDTLMCTSE
jgi:hypothetical protein